MRDLIWAWRLRHPVLAAFAGKLVSDLVPAVAVSIAAGLVVAHLGTPPAGPGYGTAPAGAAMVQLLREEHELIADVLRRDREREQEVVRIAEAERRDAAEVAIAARAAAAAARIALSVARNPDGDASAGPTRPSGGEGRQVARLGKSPMAGEPLQLLAMTDPAKTAAVTERRTAASPVRDKLRQLASTVDQIPVWFRDAAHWVGDLPDRILPTRGATSERRLLSVSI